MILSNYTCMNIIIITLVRIINQYSFISVCINTHIVKPISLV